MNRKQQKYGEKKVIAYFFVVVVGRMKKEEREDKETRSYIYVCVQINTK